MKFCNQDISKTTTARIFKLGLPIEHDKEITWLKYIKTVFQVFELLAFASLDIENL